MTTNKSNQLDFVQLWADAMNKSHRAMNDNEFSVTESLKDPTAIVLRRRHRNEINSDVQDTSDANAGTAVHESLEEYMEKCGYVTEYELRMGIGEIHGRKVYIVGRIDGYNPDERRLVDVKNTKLATFNKNQNGSDTDWIDQLSIYEEIMENCPPEWYMGCKTREITARITDLSVVKEAMAGNSTDKWRRLVYDAPRAEAIARAYDNIEKAISLENTPDDELPICSDEYRFASKTYKIYKRKAKNSEETNKTAVTGHAKYETMDDAVKGFDNAGFTLENYVIKEVGGESLRCKYYCDVKDFCPHYKKMMEAINGTVQTA